VLRGALLNVSANSAIKNFATTAPGISELVTQFAAGETTHDAIGATNELVSQGFLVTLDHLGEDTTDVDTAVTIRDAYVELLQRLGRAQLASHAEVSVKLSAVGQALAVDGPQIATDNARRICEVARDVGTTVTLDMEDHTTTDLTLSTLAELREDFPQTGAVLQAYLRRTETDCRDLGTAGSRVRLCKGAYNEPEAVAYQRRGEVDLSYVRCLKVLLQGEGYPMIATHDSRLIAVAEALCTRYDRKPDDHEFQMLYGVRRREQRRLAEIGQQVRVYVPYGAEWYGYLVRRMAERPANLMLGVRAMLGRG
jgi:proline dehydrogenase